MTIRSQAFAPQDPADPVRTTLLELVSTIGEITEDECELVATVIHLVRSGQVRLIGNFRGQPIIAA